MKDSRVSEVLISKESLIKKKGERTDFVMEDDLSEASDYPSSHSSLSLNIRKKIDSLKCSSPAYDSEVESVQSVTELPLSKMEELIQKAIETNSDLRMQLLLCERQLVLLKMRLPKKELIVENEVSNRDSTRGFLSKFMAPYFKDEKGYGIWTDRIKSLSEFSFLQCYNGSSSQRKDYLRVAVAIKQCLVEEKMGQRNLKSLNEKIVSALNREELCAAMKEVRSAEAEIKALKKKTIWKLLESDVDRELDWMKISTYEAANGLSASDCESIWNIVLKPQHKFQHWTKQRQQLLKESAIKHNFQCWEDIALEIGGGLTGFLAFARFASTLSHLVMTNGAWSKEEDSHLLDVIKASTIGKEILWGKVAYYVEDRSMTQCITRWYKINPAIKRGRFTVKEDALLLHSVDKFSYDFEKIASVFGNRNLAQLRGRYIALKTNSDKDKITGEWSMEEDKLLLKLVKKYGESKWSHISKEMLTRNRVQIRHRYSVLKKKLKENPELDLKSLSRFKRNKGTHNRKAVVDSLMTTGTISRFIENKLASGHVTVRPPARPGRRCSVPK